MQLPESYLKFNDCDSSFANPNRRGLESTIKFIWKKKLDELFTINKIKSFHGIVVSNLGILPLLA